MNKLSKVIIALTSLLLADSIARYFNVSITDAVCIGFIADIICDIIIDRWC